MPCEDKCLSRLYGARRYVGGAADVNDYDDEESSSSDSKLLTTPFPVHLFLSTDPNAKLSGQDSYMLGTSDEPVT